jgi:hypothetical protein
LSVFKKNRTTQVLITLCRPSNIGGVDAIATMVGRKLSPYLTFSFVFFSIESTYQAYRGLYIYIVGRIEKDMAQWDYLFTKLLIVIY